MKIKKETLKCAMCGEKSTQEVYYSTNNIGTERHLDLRNDYGTVNIPIQECPHCHYCDFDITDNNGVGKDFIESQEYQDVLNSQLDENTKKYILSGMVNEKAGKEKSAALMYLGASWSFEDAEDKENTKKYRQKAYGFLIPIALKEEDGDILLQCVDLLRKDEEFDRAMQYLDMLSVDIDKLSDDVKGDENFVMVQKIINFERTLIENKDSKDYLMDDVDKKMSFVDFNTLFIKNSGFNNAECSMLASVFYNLEEEYFKAVVGYLENGERKDLIYENYSIEKIVKAYMLEEDKTNYLKALLILNNIKGLGNEGFLIYYPNTIE